MAAAEALAAIRGLASAGRYIVTTHAAQRMQQRGVRHRDVRSALSGAVSVLRQAGRETWLATGPDVDGDDLTLAVMIEGDLIVITVFQEGTMTMTKNTPERRRTTTPGKPKLACVSCDSARLERGVFPFVLTLASERDGVPFSRKFRGDVAGYRCGACTEVFFDGPKLEHFERLVATWLVEHGYESGAELRFVRKCAGLRAADLAEILAVSLQTVSSWENGKHAADAPTRAQIGALALDAFEGRTATRDRLQAMREPARKVNVRLPENRAVTAAQ